MYRVIMVPVDGSAFSREAVFQGLRLARKSGARLRLVRVAPGPIMSGGPDTMALESAAWTIERDDLRTQLYRLAAECKSNSNVEISATVEEGPVADALRGHALRHGVDLIVMATHARRGISRAFLGSVADQLIRESGIPVLVVRPPSLATELIDGPCYKRIIVPLDGSSLAERSLQFAVALAKIEHAQLTLLRIVTPEKTAPAQPGAWIAPRRAAGIDEAERYLAKMRIALVEPGLHIHSAVVVADDVPRAIAGFAQASDEDLIAIATHGRGGIARAIIGSVADRVMSEGLLSMLVVHPSELPVRERVLQSPHALSAAFA
ncbi:MAG TPA: universal stress protein [Gemmatimonadaceae bacterium]|nr:universal stress protein [Gemmatimonadaceae bacterium]